MSMLIMGVPTTNEEIQRNYDKLKTGGRIIWKQYSKAEGNITEGNRFIILNEKKLEILLCEMTSEKYFSTNSPLATERIEVKGIQVEAIEIGVEFFTANIIETVSLPENFSILKGIGNKVYSQLIDLSKGHHEQRRQMLIAGVPLYSEIYHFLQSDGEENGCIAYKKEGCWGFLYYNKKGKNPYTFHFEPINNYRDDVKLTPKHEGYRDFTYFMIAIALPMAYKIGRAEDPDKRLNQLNGANHREIKRLAVIPDGRMEAVYKTHFKQWLCYKKIEWFEIHKDLTDLINKVQSEAKIISAIYKKQKEHHEAEKEKS